MKKYVIQFAVAAAFLSVLTTSTSVANAQTDLATLQGAVQRSTAQRRGSFKVRPRFFNPFSRSRSRRLEVEPFGASFFSAFSSPFEPFDDPFNTGDSQDTSSLDSSPQDNGVPTDGASADRVPIVIAPVSGGQAFIPILSPSSSSSSGFPWVPRPVRSPYRPPPRPPF